MATYTPPPYFPQGALSPPDEQRYRKFKLLVVMLALALLLLLTGTGVAIWFLARLIFW